MEDSDSSSSPLTFSLKGTLFSLLESGTVQPSELSNCSTAALMADYLTAACIASLWFYAWEPHTQSSFAFKALTSCSSASLEAWLGFDFFSEFKIVVVSGWKLFRVCHHSMTLGGGKWAVICCAFLLRPHFFSLVSVCWLVFQLSNFILNSWKHQVCPQSWTA